MNHPLHLLRKPHISVGTLCSALLTMAGLIAAYSLWFDFGLSRVAWEAVRRVAGSHEAFAVGMFTLGVLYVGLRWVRRLRRRRWPSMSGAPVLGPAVAGPAVVAAAAPGPFGSPEETVARIARHEAVHAVAGVACGAKVEEILTRPLAPGGHTLMRWARIESPQEAADTNFRSLVATLAPHVDEISRGLHQVGAGKDLQEATETTYLIQAIGVTPAGVTGPLSTENLLEHGRREALRIIETASRRIERVTAVLAAHPHGVRITGRTLVDLVGDRAPTGAFPTEELAALVGAGRVTFEKTGVEPRPDAGERRAQE